jgi:flagellar hook-associated protein 1 FlgK
MASLFSALSASANTLGAFERALNVTQNNVSNASTPGYAAQNAILTPLPFDPVEGPAGGVAFSGASSTRDEYAEQAVQQQQSLLGSANSLVGTLTALDPSFDISGQTGLSAALPAFFSSFSALSQDSNDTTARQQVLTSAQNVATAFQDTATAVTGASQSADQQIGSTVTQIDTLATQIAQINQQQLQNAQPDPDLDASLHNDLETLSQLTNFTTSFTPNGSVSVLIGGQTPLVMGSQSYAIQSNLAPVNPGAIEPAGTPSRIITDSEGNDITSQITGGSLGGLLQVRNTILPGIIGSTTQPGSLNQLAQSLSGGVNSLLMGGYSSSGPPPVLGVPLFQSSSGNTVAAQTLSVTTITPQQIAAIDPATGTANGIALEIGNLPTSTNPNDTIDGLSYTAYYGQVAANFGQQLSDATTNQQQETQSVAQAQSLRSQISGVFLDEEATQLIEYQNAYQATSKLVTVIDSLTEDTINLIS